MDGDINCKARAPLADDADLAFIYLVHRYSPAVYSLQLRLTGSRFDAADLSQDTFLRAYRALRAFTPERRAELQPRGWLMTIALNVWRNHLRHRSRTPVMCADRSDEGHKPVAVDPSTSPEDQVAGFDALDRLATSVAQLPDHQRLPVVLRHVEELSYSEIAAKLGCPVGTAKANASRGVARLRLILQQQGSDALNTIVK